MLVPASLVGRVHALLSTPKALAADMPTSKGFQDLSTRQLPAVPQILRASPDGGLR